MLKKVLISAIFLIASTVAMAGPITIEKQRIAVYSARIDNAEAQGLISPAEANQLREQLSEIQAKDLQNTKEDLRLQNNEVNRDLDVFEFNLEGAINYGK